VHLVLSSTGLDEHDIAVLDDVILALGHNLTSSLDAVFITVLTERRVVVHDGLDEGLLEVGVNDTSRSGSLDALADGPLPNLVLTSGEEAAQVQSLAHGSDDLRQTGLGAQSLALSLSGRIIVHQGQTLLELSRDGKDGVAGRVGLDPLEDFGEVLVLLADVISLAQVDKVHNGLSSEQEQGVDDFDL
jgi:hypothetical protein